MIPVEFRCGTDGNWFSAAAHLVPFSNATHFASERPRSVTRPSFTSKTAQPLACVHSGTVCHKSSKLVGGKPDFQTKVPEYASSGTIAYRRALIVDFPNAPSATIIHLFQYAFPESNSVPGLIHCRVVLFWARTLCCS